MCTVHYITKRTVHWSSYWKRPLPTTRHASHLVNTLLKTVCSDCQHITDTTCLKISLKSSSVSARIDFIRPVPEKSATHNSHMASDLVNKQVPKKTKAAERTVAPFCSKTRKFQQTFHNIKFTKIHLMGVALI